MRTAWLVVVLAACSNSGNSREPSAAPSRAPAAPTLEVTGSSFRCGPGCSGNIEYSNVVIGGPVGTHVRVAGTDHEVDARSPNQFRLDGAALADQLGVDTMLAPAQTVRLPLEVTVPGQATMRGEIEVENHVYAKVLAVRLAEIAARPLATRDATTTGALVVVKPEDPSSFEPDAWQVRKIGDVQRPREAKLVIVGTPTRAKQACGRYRDAESGAIVDLQLNLLDVELQAFEPSTGKIVGSRLAKAPRACPDKTTGLAMAGQAGSIARFDEKAVVSAAESLLRAKRS